jgi:Flp pilus assembly protein TadG
MRAKRNNLGSVLVEAALAIPVFLFLVFGFIEMSRMLYIKATMSAAAQQVANLIAVNAKRTPSYNVSNFSTYADAVRFPGSVISSGQFSFNVTDAGNNTTVTNGMADGALSTKVVITVVFPPPGDSTLKVPLLDPGRLFGAPLFGQNGLQLSAQAVSFLERSRRPVLN